MQLSKLKRDLASVLICTMVMTGLCPSYVQAVTSRDELYDDLIIDEDEGFYDEDEEEDHDDRIATASDSEKATPSNLKRNVATPSGPEKQEVATPSQALVDAAKSFNRPVTFVDMDGNRLGFGDSLEIPETNGSYPYLSQGKGRTKGGIDLEAYGYEEAEYFLGGTANVYDIRDGRLATVSDAEYVNRVLVFRPEDAGDFHGAVFVDILNASSKVDVPDIWRRSYDYFMTYGYVYVGITSKDVNVAALKEFDSRRYGVLDWRDRDGTTENGLFWDMLGQLGVLLKAEESPLLYGDETGQISTYLMGQSQSGWYVNTFSNQFSKANFILEDPDMVLTPDDMEGDPIFDGFFNVVGSMMDAPIARKQTDRSAMFKPVAATDVPYILLVGENDYNPQPVRDDSDENGNLYRHYVIAGGPHSSKIFLPDPLDEIQLKAGRPAGDYPSYKVDAKTGRPNTVSDMNMDVFVNAALENLHQWASEGTPAPYGPSKDEIEGSVSGMAFVPARDDYGNMATGILSPQLSVPVASYYGGANGGFNTDGGSMVYLDDETLQSLYTDRDDYLAQFEAALDKAIEDRWILETDRDLMMGLAQKEPVFSNPARDDEAIRETMAGIPKFTVQKDNSTALWQDVEYLVEGNANLYGVLRDNLIYKRRMYALPYKNAARVCIPQNFNGEVVLDLIVGDEPEKDIGAYMEAGKAYVAITATPEAARAKGGNWEIPYKKNEPREEPGLVWDMISQMVTAIRNSDALGGLAGRVRTIRLEPDDGDGDMAYTYALVFHQFDGYGLEPIRFSGSENPIFLNSIDKTVPVGHVAGEEPEDPVQPEDPDQPENPDQPVKPWQPGHSGSGSGGGGGKSTSTSNKDNGDWTQDENGWWFRFADGTWPANRWAKLTWNGSACWYFFNTEGYMVTGWLDNNGDRYYLHREADGTQGYMYTGWHLIDGNWYYFQEVPDDTEGRLLTDMVTPDGYQVGADGVWIP